MAAIQMLRLQLGVYDRDELLLLLLDNAKEMLLDYLGRDSLPERLISVQVQLAIIAYNRQGVEGNSSVHEGGISFSVINGLPAEFKERLKHYPRKVGVMRKAESNKNDL